MAESMDQLAGKLLIQCRPSEAEVAVEIARAHQAGVVLTGASCEAAVVRLRDRGFEGPILCDADRYSGKRRVPAGRGITPQRCRRQQDLGLVALTDSGYLAMGNILGLRSILRAAARQQGPVLAMLPMSARWFRFAPFAAALAREINDFGIPVAIAIEHGKDPFSSRYLVRGFCQLLRASTVPVLLLRSDVSALGALCHGAHAAAVGTASSLRHLYPVVSRRPVWRQPSMLVKALLSYHKLETCHGVFDETSDLEHLWKCDCPACYQALSAGRHVTGDPAAAARHSLYVQLALREELHRRARTRDQLISSWHETCSHALFVHDQIAEKRPSWREPAHLRAWVDESGDPLPHRSRLPEQASERQVRSPRRATE